jgi:hypothetical protein
MNTLNRPSNESGTVENTTKNSSILYEPPALLELGKAEELTLGTAGSANDNCVCSLAYRLRLF